MKGNENYLLKNNCQNITGLNVTFVATQDMVSDNGFSVQLNAYNPAGPTTSIMQYVLAIFDNFFGGVIQYWDGAKCQTNPNCQTVNEGAVIPSPSTISGNTIPAGWTLAIALNDNGGNITGATFTVTDNLGHSSTSQVSVPAGFLFPIVGFQVDVVGPQNGIVTTFTHGAATITYRANSQLCVEGGLPEQCSNSAGSGFATAEDSNATYGPMSSCCSSVLSQALST